MEYVYYIKIQTNDIELYKIGYSANIDYRIQTFKRKNNTITLLKSFEFETKQDALKFEKYIKTKYKTYLYTKYSNTEIFNTDVLRVYDFIEYAILDSCNYKIQNNLIIDDIYFYDLPGINKDAPYSYN